MVVTGISGQYISAASAAYAPTNSSDVSAIASSYQVVSSLADDGTYITAINGSALSGAGGGGATGDCVEKSATEVAIGSGNSATSTSFAQGTDNTASGASFAQGQGNSASSASFAQGVYNSAKSISFAGGKNNIASSQSFVYGLSNSASASSVAIGRNNSAVKNAVAIGYENSAFNRCQCFGWKNILSGVPYWNEQFMQTDYKGGLAIGIHNSASAAAFVIGDGIGSNTRHDLMTVSWDGEITMYSSTADTAGTGIMSSIRAISAAATGGVDSATVSAIASAYQVVSSVGDDGTYVTSINGSALAGGGVDSATVSSIASSYAESAASGKLDTTAFNSGDFYTTANESGYVGSAYVDSAVSGKMDTSGMTSYALSADVSGTVDLVSTQSANWGGSALALSAGPGVKLEKVGNTLVASTDETVLWSGSSTGQNPSFILSEPVSNFEYIEMFAVDDDGWVGSVKANTDYCTTANRIVVPVHHYGIGGKNFATRCIYVHPVSETSFDAAVFGFDYSNNAALNEKTHMTKIVGINRTTEA